MISPLIGLVTVTFSLEYDTTRPWLVNDVVAMRVFVDCGTIANAPIKP